MEYTDISAQHLNTVDKVSNIVECPRLTFSFIMCGVVLNMTSNMTSLKPENCQDANFVVKFGVIGVYQDFCPRKLPRRQPPVPQVTTKRSASDQLEHIRHRIYNKVTLCFGTLLREELPSKFPRDDI